MRSEISRPLDIPLMTGKKNINSDTQAVTKKSGEEFRDSEILRKRQTTENEKKKEFLSTYQKAKQKVERLEQQLGELRFNKLAPPAVSNDGMPHKNDISDLSDYMVKLDEIESDITSARYERICAFQRIQYQIEKMDDEHEKDLLTYRYIKGMKWEQVAVKMGYSWRKIHYLHSKALEHFSICA